ncbi:MAG TPA: sigma-70 family RNA polymerase sigma factor, partial [Pyrinomonadaceae bacterium]|nr:sigma-70 family RNA polymerase sigma factor [Pyrinomonadaceae bacterium]
AFTTFSYYRIRGAIYDGLREMGVLTRVSPSRERFRANANDVQQTAIDDELGATTERAGEEVEDKIVEAQSLIDALIPAYLLSLESDQVPQIADQTALSPQQLEMEDLGARVRALITELSPDEQHLLRALYFQQQSMTDLAKNTNVTKSWISRRHARAIQQLRELMIANRLIDVETGFT